MRLSPSERDPVKVADWAEIQILYSGQTGISLESVRTHIDKDATLDDELDSEREELGQENVWPEDATERLIAYGEVEIQRRIEIGKANYPFRIVGSRLELSAVADKCMPYTFCLLASDRELWNPGEQQEEVLFEHLVSKALASYLGGSSVRFGTPRDTMPAGMQDAIMKLASLSKSRVGGGYPTNPHDQDLGLDVAGWKEFPDGHSGIVQVYLQCTTQQTWEKKKVEPDLDAWSGVLAWPLRPLKGLAIPYVVSNGESWHRAASGGILFDRLRIAVSLDGVELTEGEHPWEEWCQGRISLGKERFFA